MDKTLRNILIVTAIIIATIGITLTLIKLSSQQAEPQQGFAYRATIEENFKRDLSVLTTDINQQIAVFNATKQDLQQQIDYAQEQKNLTRVTIPSLSFH